MVADSSKNGVRGQGRTSVLLVYSDQVPDALVYLQQQRTQDTHLWEFYLHASRAKAVRPVFPSTEDIDTHLSFSCSLWGTLGPRAFLSIAIDSSPVVMKWFQVLL